MTAGDSEMGRDFDRALDRMTVPPPSAGFADRIMAAAAVRQIEPAPPVRRRGRRWTRARGFLAGGVALSLMSATAAAAGLFGDTSHIPVIGPMIAAVQSVAAPKAVAVKPRPTAPAKVAPPVAVPFSALPRAAQNRAIADRVLSGIERRDDARAARGLPPRRPAVAKKIEAFKAATPAEQEAIVERARGLREERRAVIRAERAPDVGEDAPLTRAERRRLLRLWREQRRAGQADEAQSVDVTPEN